MIIQYRYRHGDCGRTAWYVTDEDDFKQMWKNRAFRDGLFWCVVKRPDENFYRVWSSAVNRWYKSQKRSWF